MIINSLATIATYYPLHSGSINKKNNTNSSKNGTLEQHLMFELDEEFIIKYEKKYNSSDITNGLTFYRVYTIAVA